MSSKALDRMWALRLEDGRHWGEAAATSPAIDGRCYQVEDAEAIFAETGPTWHFLTRPRGASKSTDIAAVALAWLTTDAPPLANGHVVASTTKQAGIVIQAAHGFCARTPELDGAVIVENEKIKAGNGAWVEVLAQSDAGAWGLRDAHFLVVDEFCQWPETTGAQNVWTAISTAAPKVAGCRLIILSSAGEPKHWSHKIYKDCLTDPLWRVNAMPGPSPWMDKAKLTYFERVLLPSVYDRLYLNVWSESEDRAISPEDYEAARQECFNYGIAPAGLRGGGIRYRFPEPRSRYIVTVDIGTKHDATVIVVAHKEPMDPDKPRGPQRMIVDHMDRWQGSKKHHVVIDDVRDRVASLSMEYNRANVYADPTQFVGALQSLNRMGVHAEEWVFSSISVGRVAASLVQTFRNHQIFVPDNPILKDELLSVKLRETAPGVARLDSDRGGHDDQAVTLGIAADILIAQPAGIGSAWLDFMKAKRIEQLEHPVKPVEAPRPSLIGQGGSVMPPRACKHRWWPDGRCVNCGTTHEEVIAMEQEKARKLVAAG